MHSIPCRYLNKIMPIEIFNYQIIIPVHEQVYLIRLHFGRKARWWEKYFPKRSLIKHTCSWRVNLLYYEHWTDKRKYFYVNNSTIIFWFCRSATWRNGESENFLIPFEYLSFLKDFYKSNPASENIHILTDWKK